MDPMQIAGQTVYVSGWQFTEYTEPDVIRSLLYEITKL